MLPLPPCYFLFPLPSPFPQRFLIPIVSPLPPTGPHPTYHLPPALTQKLWLVMLSYCFPSLHDTFRPLPHKVPPPSFSCMPPTEPLLTYSLPPFHLNRAPDRLYLTLTVPPASATFHAFYRYSLNGAILFHPPQSLCQCVSPDSIGNGGPGNQTPWLYGTQKCLLKCNFSNMWSVTWLY